MARIFCWLRNPASADAAKNNGQSDSQRTSSKPQGTLFAAIRELQFERLLRTESHSSVWHFDRIIREFARQPNNPITGSHTPLSLAVSGATRTERVYFANATRLLRDFSVRPMLQAASGSDVDAYGTPAFLERTHVKTPLATLISGHLGVPAVSFAGSSLIHAITHRDVEATPSQLYLTNTIERYVASAYLPTERHLRSGVIRAPQDEARQTDPNTFAMIGEQRINLSCRRQLVPTRSLEGGQLRGKIGQRALVHSLSQEDGKPTPLRFRKPADSVISPLDGQPRDASQYAIRYLDPALVSQQRIYSRMRAAPIPISTASTNDNSTERRGIAPDTTLTPGSLPERARVTQWTPTDLAKLTDHIIQALDMRIIAHRERMGRTT